MSACDRLDEYLCGWLEADERAAFQRHLAECADCQAERELQQRMDQALARFPESVTVPDTLTENVVIRRPIERQPRLAAVLVAAAIGLTIALGLMIWNRPQTPAPIPSPEIVQGPMEPAPEVAPPETPAQSRASLRPGDGMIAVAVPTENPTVTIFQLYSTTPRLPDDRLGDPGELEEISP